MKKSIYLLALAAALSGSPAWAEDVSDVGKGGRVAEVYNELQLSGSIEKIDHDQGLVTLNSELGKVELKFSPSDIRGFQNGDPVKVDLGFSQRGRSIGLNRMADTLEIFNELQVTGTIRQINYRTGELSLDTKAGDVTLNFPPTAVKELKRDDTITVNMGYSPQGRTIHKR